MASQFTDEHELRATVGRFRSRAGQVFVRELTSEERKSISLDNEDKIRAKRLTATSDFGRGFAVGVGVSFIVASAIYLYLLDWLCIWSTPRFSWNGRLYGCKEMVE